MRRGCKYVEVVQGLTFSLIAHITAVPFYPNPAQVLPLQAAIQGQLEVVCVFYDD